MVENKLHDFLETLKKTADKQENELFKHVLISTYLALVNELLDLPPLPNCVSLGNNNYLLKL